MVQWINMVEFTYTQHMVGRSEPWKKTGSMILFIYSSERDRNIEATQKKKKKGKAGSDRRRIPCLSRPPREGDDRGQGELSILVINDFGAFSEWSL